MQCFDTVCLCSQVTGYPFFQYPFPGFNFSNPGAMKFSFPNRNSIFSSMQFSTSETDIEEKIKELHTPKTNVTDEVNQKCKIKELDKKLFTKDEEFINDDFPAKRRKTGLDDASDKQQESHKQKTLASSSSPINPSTTNFNSWSKDFLNFQHHDELKRNDKKFIGDNPEKFNLSREDVHSLSNIVRYVEKNAREEDSVSNTSSATTLSSNEQTIGESKDEVLDLSLKTTRQKQTSASQITPKPKVKEEKQKEIVKEISAELIPKNQNDNHHFSSTSSNPVCEFFIYLLL